MYHQKILIQRKKESSIMRIPKADLLLIGHLGFGFWYFVLVGFGLWLPKLYGVQTHSTTMVIYFLLSITVICHVMYTIFHCKFIRR